MLAMGQVNLLKLVIVVEDDIDPENPRDVEWSLAARFRGHEDLVVVPGVKADRCDPVHEDLTVTKIGMVATTRPGDGEVRELIGICKSTFNNSRSRPTRDRSVLGSDTSMAGAV